ncbi:MAG TPA: nucleotidyltransferase domain-containing protein [Tepidisphaeraceae bacterium]|nr:nucleotidyltransferase domain-containing protein [Tepidisphaeraceae bacterium]
MTLLKPENLRIELPLETIASICRRFNVEQLSIFGSSLRPDFSPASDVDFLVIFKNGEAGEWAFKYTELSDELSSVLGRKVEVVSQRAVEQSENYLRRKRILREAQVVYVA